jgi:putative toxin-antitoxin system antitoxin component (TIGR02293 family)
MNMDAVDTRKERETVVRLLDIPKRPSSALNSNFAYIQLIKSGLKNRSVNSFIRHSSFTKKQVSRIIHVSERTLQRNTPDKTMDLGVSERLIDLARLFHRGMEVFDEKEKFLLWLNRPNKSLDNQLPIELIETNMGMDLVMDELLKIEHGVFS